MKNKILLSLLIPFVFIGCKTTPQTVIVKNHIEQIQDNDKIESINTTFASTDKNGNIELSINASDFLLEGYKYGDIVDVEYNGKKYSAPIVSQYDDVDNGAFLVRVYDENVEFAISYENCSDEIGSVLNEECSISMNSEFGFQTEYEMRYLETSLDREDYLSDESFANFRNVDFGEIKKGILYRSCSPTVFNARSPYASILAQEVGIKNIVNLDDNSDTLIRDLGFMSNDWYKNLYDKGDIFLVDMNADYRSPEFGEKVAQSMRYLINNEGPYLIHGDDGRTRTGFVFVVIEALMGANQDEIEADYMQSYVNYYGIEKGTYQYNYAKQNPYEMLASIACGIQLQDEHFSAIANYYLLSIGLSEEEILSLKRNLSE
jgi:protein tyrosine/serine phosphatase